MKKFLLILIIFAFSFQLAFAQQKYDMPKSNDIVTVTGKVKMLSIEDAWIVVKIEGSFAGKLWGVFMRLLKAEKEKTNEYRVNILESTKIESSSREEVLLENITIGETVSVTGKLIEEMTEKESGLIEAQYIKVFRSKTIVAVISDFFNFNRESYTVGVARDDAPIVSNYFGDNKLPDTDQTFNNDKCVSEGEPIILATLLAPKVNTNCCDGLQQCLSKDTTQMVKINGFQYTVLGYCRKECIKDIDLDKNDKGQFWLQVSKDKPWEAPLLPQVPRVGCQSDSQCPKGFRCANGLCVAKTSGLIDVAVNKYCNRTDECTFNGSDCVTEEPTLMDSILNLFIKEDKRCICLNNMCSLATSAPAGAIDSKINCGDEVFQVCGNNNITYRNPCEALKAGVEIQCNKACPCFGEDKKDDPISGVIPGDDPMMCKSNAGCFWCNEGCFTKSMIDGGMNCDDNKKIPSGMTCMCDTRTGMCKLVAKGSVMPTIPTTKSTTPTLPDNICSKDSDCGFCGPNCLTNNIIQKMSSGGNSCIVSMEPKNAKCVCRMGNCVQEIMTTTTLPVTTTTKVTPTTPVVTTTKPVSNALQKILVNGFCGEQTNGSCGIDSDCMVSGCSGTVCQAKNEPVSVTTCLWEECYTKPSNVYCGCNSGKCQWYSAKTNPLIPVVTTTIPLITTTTLPGINPGLITTPVITPPNNGIIVPPSSGPCAMVMMCLNGRVHTADCGEVGNKCYVFQETGNGNCYCIQ